MRQRLNHSTIIKAKSYFLAFSLLLLHHQVTNAQTTTPEAKALTERQKAITLISAFTAKGDLPKLRQALNTGLDAGLTINECKEVLVHSYAYCGFPRSIQGLNTLMSAL